MKTQITRQHTDVMAVQPSTIFNPKTRSRLLWQALAMLLLLVASVVPGTAQGIYVASSPQYGNYQAYIGEYKPDGSPKNTHLVNTMPYNSMVMDQIAVFGSNLLVPIDILYQLPGYVRDYGAVSGAGASFSSFNLISPTAAAVSGGRLFVLYQNYGTSVIGEYDATTGVAINPFLSTLSNMARSIAASRGPGGSINLFVTGYGSSSIQEITVSGSVATPPTTFISGLHQPQGIAVSDDGQLLYVVVPSDGKIYEYNAVWGSFVRTLVSNISGTPWDIAVSGSNLLVTLPGNSSIGEYNLSTGAWNPSLVTFGLYLPTGIAVTPGDGTTFCTPPPSNMVAWYSFDQNLPGGPQYDLAKGNDASGSFWGQWGISVAGKVSNALSFGGADSLQAPDKSWLNMGTGPFSIDMWVRTSSSSGLQVLVDKRQSSPLQGYHLYLWNGVPGLQLADSNGYYNYNAPIPALSPGVWYHIAVTVSRTWNGGNWYVNGQWKGTFDPSAHPNSLSTPGVPLEIGVRDPGLGGGGFFSGGMDELEIFNRALTGAEVQAIYNAGSAGKCK